MGKYSEKETKNRRKITCLLIISFSLGMAKADTVKIVSDTAYAPFEFSDSDQTYKGVDVDIINKVARDQRMEHPNVFILALMQL